MIKIGYAETDITPKKPVETVGFNRKDNISRGILKPLLAQVSVWSTNSMCCLITVDSIGFKRELTDKLRKLVANTLNISTDKVMICFSHCHSAPNADAEEEYYNMVCENIKEASKIALNKMYPVVVGYENTFADIGVNRRVESKDIDRRVGIVKICDATSHKIKLLLLRLTAHCNVLKQDNYFISPDYFGDVRKVLQEKYDCPIMVIQGSAGNIAPKYFKSEINPIDARGDQYIKSKTALEDMANMVSQQVNSIIENIKLNQEYAVDMYAKNTILYAQVPSNETALKIAIEANEMCGIDGQAWIGEVKKLNNKGITTQKENVEVQYFTIGDWCLCGVPYELMVQFAIETMKKLDNPYFYLNGYTNGCLSYFPTEEEFDLGGYEVYWSILIYYSYFNRVFPLMRESASKLIEFVVNNTQKDIKNFS